MSIIDQAILPKSPLDPLCQSGEFLPLVKGGKEGFSPKRLYNDGLTNNKIPVPYLLDSFELILYNLIELYQPQKSDMKNIVSISNARKDLPKMIKEIQRNPETVFQIAVRNETIAEIRSAKTQVVPGEAVRKLIHLRKNWPPPTKGRSGSPFPKGLKITSALR